MKINRNNDISLYREETGAIDFKISQRSDYYVPFLISSARIPNNPMVCITIGSTRRESKNIVTKQLWLELTSVPKFVQTTVIDLGTITLGSNVGVDDTYELILAPQITAGHALYQFLKATEVAAGNPQLHFAYEVVEGTVLIDQYNFTVIMALDETITLDMTGTDYFYHIELMNTVLMIPHLISVFNTYPALISKLPAGFANTELGVAAYRKECIALVTKTFPNHWGYRVLDPLTSPIASVSAIQMLQPPRKFTVHSVIK